MIYLLLLNSLLNSHADLTPEMKATFACITSAQNLPSQVGTPTLNHDDAIHLCRGTDSTSPIICAKRALKELNIIPFGPFSNREAIELCAGANSVAPVECAKEAMKQIHNLESPIKSNADIVTLCHRASSNHPINCVNQLKPEMKAELNAPVQNFSDIINLCSPH